jgi:hypothetical protein
MAKLAVPSPSPPQEERAGERRPFISTLPTLNHARRLARSHLQIQPEALSSVQVAIICYETFLSEFPAG